MFKLYNPNPHGRRVGDCVVRAVSKALDQDWGDTYLDLTIQGYIVGDLLSSNGVWGAFLRSKGFNRDLVSADCPECYTVQDFCRDHPQGTYVIGTGTHAIAVIDGCYYDAWDSGNEIVIYYWKRKEE